MARGKANVSLKVKVKGSQKSKLNEQTVRQAAAALLAFHKKKSEQAAQADLLNEFSQIKLIISLWKITGKKAKTYQIDIPHPLRTAETEVCLFTKDDHRNDNEASARHYQELLQSKGVTEVNEVMPLQVLKKEYKAFDSRRQLAKRYDIFLADERIFRLMHVLLGKEFYRRKKYPITVNITKGDLKSEILKAINATYFINTNRGNTNHLTAAHTGMTVDQVTENIMAAVQGVTAKIPYGWQNIKALYVRTDESVSLALHTSLVFKGWEAKTDVNLNDILRLKNQLEVTGNKALRAKPRITPEQDAQARRFQKRSKKNSAVKETAKKSQSSEDAGARRKGTKRKAASEEVDAPKRVVKRPARMLVKEKTKLGASRKKAQMTKRATPGKLTPKKSVS